MRIKVKQTEPLIRECKVESPCIGVCSTSTIGTVWCVGCSRHYQDVIRWNQYSVDDKILAIYRAKNHEKLKSEGKADDWHDYQQETEGFNIKEIKQ